MTEQDENPKVFASPEFRQRYGDMTDRIGVWAGRPVLILSIHDGKSPSMTLAEAFKDVAKGLKDPLTDKPRASPPGVDVQQRIDEFIRYTGSEMTPEGMKILNDKVLPSVKSGNAFYATVSMSEISKSYGLDSNAAIIATSHFDISKNLMAGFLTGISAQNFKNLPGSDMEWHSIVIMHECAHAREPNAASRKNGNSAIERLSLESRADQFAVEQYRSEVEAGNLKDPRVPEAYMAMRAIGAFTKLYDREHATGAAVRIPGEEPPQGGTGEYFDYQRDQALNKVYMFAGMGMQDAGSRTSALLTILDHMTADGESISEEDNQIIDDILTDSSAMAEQEIFDVRIKALSPHLQEAIKGELEFQALNVGTTAVTTDPQLLYESTRQVFFRGGFDDDPIQKQYAREFLGAANKYLPGYFGVDKPVTDFEAKKELTLDRVDSYPMPLMPSRP